ncbi:hypothetical protein [Flavobacterium sp. I3-2]|uniref:hypothetical protein n=1 Tax=Flavobacterium sp. I3-2 TaxID=2748319 RepID=UPI0015A9633D|nr:hypothetical protein [Flavobacterium sp. I3-2]
MDRLQTLFKICYIINSEGQYKTLFNLADTNFISIYISELDENNNLKGICINQGDNQAVLDGIEILKKYLKPVKPCSA